MHMWVELNPISVLKLHTMTTAETCLPITTPLSQQDRLPQGLPHGWMALELDQRLSFLRANAPLISVEAFVSGGLEAGAEQLDRVAEKSGGVAIHHTIFVEELGTAEVFNAFNLGKTEYLPQQAFPENPKQSRRSYGTVMSAAEVLAEKFGYSFVNPTLLFDATGRKMGVTKMAKSAPAAQLGESVLTAMDHAEWDTELKGLGALLTLHQAANKRARAFVNPLLAVETRSLPNQERQFWQSRLSGTESNNGLAYYFGYRAKSAPTLRSTMQTRWSEAYGYNRAVFATALNINAKDLNTAERSKIQNKLRRPVFAHIGQGNFEAAYGLLREYSIKQPGLFALPGLQFLQPENRQNTKG